MDMRPYCFPMEDNEFQKKNINDLVAEGLCPSWIVESKPLFGRCLPALSNDVGANDNDTIIPSHGTVIKEPVKKGTLKVSTLTLSNYLAF